MVISLHELQVTVAACLGAALLLKLVSGVEPDLPAAVARVVRKPKEVK